MAKAWIYKQQNKAGKQIGYYVMYDVGLRADGHRDRRKKSGFSTKREAQAWIVRFEGDIQKGIIPPRPSRITVRDYLMQWYDAKIVPTASAKTEEGYRSVIRAHLVPTLGNLYLRDLSHAHIQDYVNTALQRLSRNTIRNHLAVLRRALNDAIAEDIVGRNVVDMSRIKLPKHQSSPYTVWTRDQRDAFLTALNDTQYYALVYTAMHTGMRRGELLGLKWSKVDFNRSEILIDEARTTVARDIRERKPFQGTKTGQYRVIPLIHDLAMVLQQHRQQLRSLSIGLADDDYVYVSYRTGTPLCQSEITRALNRIQATLELPHMRFHGFRHLFATIALQNNVPLSDVSAILGHARTSVTLDIYTHVLHHTHSDKMAQITAAMSG